MGWFAVTALVFGLAIYGVATRRSAVVFALLFVFVPLARYTLNHAFDRFWILILLCLLVQVVALCRHGNLLRRLREALSAPEPEPEPEGAAG